MWRWGGAGEGEAEEEAEAWGAEPACFLSEALLKRSLNVVFLPGQHPAQNSAADLLIEVSSSREARETRGLAKDSPLP